MLKRTHKEVHDNYIKPCPMCGYHIQQGWRKDNRGPQHVDWFNSHASGRPIVIYCVNCPTCLHLSEDTAVIVGVFGGQCRKNHPGIAEMTFRWGEIPTSHLSHGNGPRIDNCV